MRIRPFAESDTEAVVDLWRSAGLTRSWNDPHRDVQRKFGVQPEWFLVGVEAPADTLEAPADALEAPAEVGAQESVVASVMAGWDGHRGWISFLAVHPDRQHEGVGTALLAEAERLLTEAGCPKVMLMVRTGNEGVLGFYEHLGWSRDDVVVLGKRLIPDV